MLPMHADGGGGVSRVLQGGNVWEKAGVNVSVVYGSMPASAYRAATERKADVGPESARVPFFAAGISSVMHPHNPHAPTMHFNYRYAAPITTHFALTLSDVICRRGTNLRHAWCHAVQIACSHVVESAGMRLSCTNM